MSKEQFIDLISNITHNELNEFIVQNGKKPRPIPLFVKDETKFKKSKENRKNENS